MGRQYEQLSLDDRCEVARLQADGQTIRQIAAALDRSPSTISREIGRNRRRGVSYRPVTLRSRRGRGAGRGLAWTATPPCAAPSSSGSRTAGPPNKWPVGWP